MHEGAHLPDHLDDFSGLCILGGPMSANDPLPYFPLLLQLVRTAVAQDTPVIGHCLGGQIMSRALGGTVQASPAKEIGWSELDTIHPAAAQWFGETASVRLFQWHGESFSIPNGAVQLLRGRHCPHQAFVVNGMHLGMQFHCEVDEPKVREWLQAGAEEIASCVSPAVQTAQALLPTLSADIAASQAIASHIYRRWATQLRQ
jgi:GMP synthase-like glutamine amidotransferase